MVLTASPGGGLLVELDERIERWQVYGLAVLFFGAYVAANAGYFPNAAGRMGNDYDRYLSQLLDGTFWALRNGYFSVPWFTPAFCAGLPKFGHPNGFYVSLTQWLSLGLSPVLAVKITVFAFAGAGYVGMYSLLRVGFGLTRPLALGGAIVFLFNTFFLSRMIVGHLAFHGYMLVPVQVLLLVVAVRQASFWPLALAAAACCIAYQFSSGMVHLAGPVALAGISLGAVCFRSEPHLFARYLAFGLAATLLAVMVGAAQMHAAWVFFAQFKRDLYLLPGFDSLASELSAVARMVFARPSLEATTAALANRQLPLELHELEYGLSPVPAVAILVGLLTTPLVRRLANKRLMLGVLLMTLGLPLALNWYQADWNQVLKQVPVIQSSSLLLRWYAAWLPVVVVAAALAVRHLLLTRHLATTLIVGLLVLLFQVRTGAGAYEVQGFDPQPIVSAWAQAKSRPGEMSITRLDPVLNLTTGVSQVYCRDDFFGYRMEQFDFEGLLVGPPTLLVDGQYNMRNPACYLFPVENSCAPGDNFLEAQADALDRFIHYDPWAFEMSRGQKIANGTSVAGALVVLCLLLVQCAWQMRAARGIHGAR